jgi:hypothetical protein
VIVLESGGEKHEPGQQALNRGEVADRAHPPAHLYRQRRLGGSTVIWGGRCVPPGRTGFPEAPACPIEWLALPAVRARTFLRARPKTAEVGVFDYSASTALPRGELVDAFHDRDMLTDSLERFSPPTRFWKRYRAEFVKSAPVTVIKYATCLRLNGDRVVTAIECVNPLIPAAPGLRCARASLL